MPGIGRGLVARPFALAEGREGDLQDHNSAPLPPSPFIRPLGSNLGEKEEEAEEEEDLRRKLVAASSRGILSPSPSLSPSTSSAAFRIFLKVFLHFGIFFFFLLALCWFFFWRGKMGGRMRHSSSSKPPPPIPTESGDAHHNHHQWHTGGPLSHFFFFYTYNPQFSFPGRKTERNGIFSWLRKNHYSSFSETRLIFLLLLTSRRIRGRATLIPNPLYYLLLQSNNTFRPKKVPPLRLFFPIQRNCSLKNTVPGKIEKVFTRST